MRRGLVEVARLHPGEGIDHAQPFVQAVGAERPVVAERAGVEVAAQADLGGIGAAVAALACQAVDDIALVADEDAVGGDGFVVALAAADAGERRQVVGEVVLAAVDHGVILLVQVGIAQAEACLRVRGVGDVGGSRAGQQRAHHAFQAFLLVQQVAGQAQALATEVQAQGEHGKLAALMVDGGIAVAVDAVEAHAEGVVLAEAPADVEVSAELAALGPVDADAGQRLVVGALGHQVDGAADAAAGGNPAEQGVRSLEHFHALGEFDRYPPERQQAIEAVEGDVGVLHAEAANRVAVHQVAAPADHPHRRIVGL